MENIENKPKRKVIRKIKKFDFSDENATVSLVGNSVGGPANGTLTLITKSKKNLSEEFLKKASQVTVTMDIVEYLQRFFGVWCDDAELLARSLGFTTPKMDEVALDQQEEMIDNQETPKKPNSWEMDSDEYNKELDRYLNYKIQSIQVMKSLFEAENIEKAVLNLSEDDYLQVLKDQEIVEKAFIEIDKACGKGKGTKPVKKNSTAIAGDTSTNVDVEKSNGVTAPVVNKSKKGNTSMTKEVQTIEQEVEVIAKSQFDEIQKAFESQQVELQKALDLVKQFEQERKENIAKSRKEQLVKACGDKAEVIFKACGEASEEDFAAVVKALADMQAVIEKSALFQEQGASVETEADIESPIAKALKARLSKQTQ